MTTVDDPTPSVDRAQVHRAAARIAPAHSDFMDQHRAWYALVGTNLYYVRELLAQATEQPAPDVVTSRKILDALGFPVFALGYRDLLDNGHPAHRE
ncbi:hypothetical protein ACFVFI_35565 [Streptomyces sp. NPDC057705]|uniref:hypothetical protein n=1 Tax=Streptomyces sp. NPDC057705 TaxID=3346222 RepID=UPI0036A61E6D